LLLVVLIEDYIFLASNRADKSTKYARIRITISWMHYYCLVYASLFDIQSENQSSPVAQVEVVSNNNEIYLGQVGGV